MTTNDGSLTPVWRLTRVAAGIPATMTSTARRMTTATCHWTGMPRLIAHQTTTVNAEAQLPGPGRSLPVPKNVAVSHAQRGACEREPASGSVAALGVELIRVSSPGITIWRIIQTGIFWIGNRSGDDVSAAGPLAEIDQTTPLAAEREVGIGAQYQLFAGRATKADCAFARHTTLTYPMIETMRRQMPQALAIIRATRS